MKTYVLNKLKLANANQTENDFINIFVFFFSKTQSTSQYTEANGFKGQAAMAGTSSPAQVPSGRFHCQSKGWKWWRGQQKFHGSDHTSVWIWIAYVHSVHPL